MRLQFGRMLRRMGLPFWTFLGIGLSGVFVNYIGLAGEVLIEDSLIVLGLPSSWAERLPPFLILFLVVVTVVAVAAWQSRRLKPISKPFGSELLPKPDGKRGLILLVSRVDSALYAIKYHYEEKQTLEYVWLIPSNDVESERFGPGSASVADEIKIRCSELEKTVEQETGERRPLTVIPWQQQVSPADAQDPFDLVNRVYRTEAGRLHLETGDIIADFTGGTKPMSVGMIMACLPTERSLEYVAFNPVKRQMSGPFIIFYQHSAFDLIG